ncbi:hypothetical protein GPX89_05810 [Nocardia sp. ET3-3]|uniref:HAD family hydrolase n=1 Tax=Nocardia terrae TaxID=2675851 RepID=A0A7K1UQZ0_9NOCA|nr:hypothetical protein [Nocardia terrae]MVU76762.1 hypothetical protein [Nocardia terrae]
MIAAVVIDLDGTLIESTGLWHAALRACPPTVTGEIAIRDRCTDYLVERAGTLRPVPGAEALVRVIAGYVPVVVATTAPARYAAALTDHLPALFDAVSSIVVGDPADGRTPAELLETAVESLGMAPHEVVALLNSSSGLLAADALGMRAMALADPHHPLSPEVASAGIPISPGPHHAAVSLLRLFRTEGSIPLRWKLIRQLLPV